MQETKRGQPTGEHSVRSVVCNRMMTPPPPPMNKIEEERRSRRSDDEEVVSNLTEGSSSLVGKVSCAKGSCSRLEAPANNAINSRVKDLAKERDQHSERTMEEEADGVGESGVGSVASTSSLKRDLGAMFSAHNANNRYADVRLWCCGKLFRAHRVVLAARSKVFDRILSCPHKGGGGNTANSGNNCNSGGKIKRQGGGGGGGGGHCGGQHHNNNAGGSSSSDPSIAKDLDMRDVDPEVLAALLSYLYTDECSRETLERQAAPLLEAADRYAVLGLKRRCEDHLCGALGEANAATMLRLAKRHGAPRLEAKAVEFVARGRMMSALSDSPAWMEVVREHPDLLGKILNATDKKRCEKCDRIIEKFYCQDHFVHHAAAGNEAEQQGQEVEVVEMPD